jgi:hypothetical protein
VDPFQTHCYSENLVAPGIEPWTSGLAPNKISCYIVDEGEHFINAEWNKFDNSKWTKLTENKQTNSVALSPRANYTDWSIATCRRNLVPTFVDRVVSRGQRGGSPTVVNLTFKNDRCTYCDNPNPRQRLQSKQLCEPPVVGNNSVDSSHCYAVVTLSTLTGKEELLQRGFLCAWCLEVISGRFIGQESTRE